MAPSGNKQQVIVSSCETLLSTHPSPSGPPACPSPDLSARMRRDLNSFLAPSRRPVQRGSRWRQQDASRNLAQAGRENSEASHRTHKYQFHPAAEQPPSNQQVFKTMQRKKSSQRARPSCWAQVSSNLSARRRPNPVPGQSLSLLKLSLLAILSISLLQHTGHGLDSPARVQRNKLLLNNNNNNNHNGSIGPPNSGPANQQVEPEFIHYSPASSGSRFDRVRRTNVGGGQPRPRAALSHVASKLAMCPPREAMHWLLPAEWRGSAATSGRPAAQRRATCECSPEPNGWHLACYPSSADSASKPALTVDNLRFERRHKKRSPTDWLGAQDTGPEEAATATSSETSHEGFDEPSTVRAASPEPAGQELRQRANESPDREPPGGRPQRGRQNLRQLDRLQSAASQHQVDFGERPTLFDIRYVRGQMIEINCVQAAPDYRASMFKGKSRVSPEVLPKLRAALSRAGPRRLGPVRRLCQLSC